METNDCEHPLVTKPSKCWGYPETLESRSHVGSRTVHSKPPTGRETQGGRHKESCISVLFWTNESNYWGQGQNHIDEDTPVKHLTAVPGGNRVR